MIAVDTNILIYAHRPESPWHDVAHRRLTELAGQPARWVVPWPCVHEFYAVVTHPRAFKTPATPAEALSFLAALGAGGSLRFVAEGAHHFELLSALARSARLSGGAIHDARIAAICLDHGVRELWTADRDFSRFPRLKTVNPLVG
jgi:toxin-antitoxin system PIN domain toxin